MNSNSTCRLSSDSLAGREGRVELRPFVIEYYFRPHGGQGAGGDRFAVCLHEGGGLWFYMADAAGHGAPGARVWEAVRVDFDEHWRELAEGLPSEEDLVHFVTRVNDALTASQEFRALHLCVVVGALSANGRLMFGTFGYGAHAMVDTGKGVWQPAPEAAFGLKLGWIPSERWLQIPGACIIHRVDQVKRVVLMTDGFLSDDYVDVHKTLRLVSDLGNVCTRLPLAEIVPYFAGVPHDKDDASLVAVEVA